MQKYTTSIIHEINFFGKKKKVYAAMNVICVFTSTLEKIAINILYRGIYGRPSWNTPRSNIWVIFRINILQSFPWHSWMKLCFKYNKKKSISSHNSPKFLCMRRHENSIKPTISFKDISLTGMLCLLLPGGQFMLEPLEILSLSVLARDQL